ncbi:SDR family oxidoreductase [Flammeovirga agarivorans]|uniref:dTDP-4-dehydrorhamnose reductase n=1 Tax=Flammeovirga agarivorans TaxID=2726742 RepID=A0A7X8SIV5_9BACT|nr:SDR family oxidoreductase [Flammeovirga agarivorans]NLR91074.1 SDR family oxidoreductase [Flammeovirga agarivorans]
MENRVLITGSNGLLGQSLLKLLKLRGNIEVFATGRGKDRFNEKGYKYHNVDLVDKVQIDNLIREVKPDVIIHGAAMSRVEDCEDNPELAIQVNTKATELLLNASRDNNVKQFIFLSTDFVFEGDKGPYSEEDDCNPPNFYGETKLKAEQLILEDTSSIIKTIIRTCLVYGQVKDMSRSNIMLWVKGKLEAKEPIKVVEDQLRTPTFVDDLAEGCILSYEKKVGGIFHISGKDKLTPFDISLKVASFLNLDDNLIEPVNASVFKEHGRRPLKTGFDISKAIEVLGYEPIGFDEGMSKVLENKV